MCQKFYKLVSLVLLFLFAQTRLSAAVYGSICGKICDADNQQPLPFTNVFLANTTWGDAADEQGAFCIERIAPGVYQYVKFDEYGNTYPPEALQIGGFWGEHRVADMLPFDYFPEKVNAR